MRIPIPQLRPLPGLSVAPDWPSIVVVHRRVVAPNPDGSVATGEVLRYQVDTRTGDRVDL